MRMLQINLKRQPVSKITELFDFVAVTRLSLYQDDKGHFKTYSTRAVRYFNITQKTEKRKESAAKRTKVKQKCLTGDFDSFLEMKPEIFKNPENRG